MKATLLEKKHEFENCFTYHFKPTSIFSYKPGDFIYLYLPKTPESDPRGKIREFSLSSSPSEKNISITFKSPPNPSKYKKELINLNIGETVNTKSPQGVYSWPPKNKNNVFIAGGIGVTPFRSRLKYNYDKNINLNINFLYLNKNINSSLFLDELTIWQNKLKFNLINHYSETSGRVGVNQIKKLIDNKSDYWITGSVSFVEEFENILLNFKISPERIKTEKFTGYK